MWLLLFACGSYSLLLVQSFFPVTEGWFQDYSNYMTSGLVMYRDFYMFIPPGFPVLMHVVGILTNNSFLAFRLYGVAESLVLVGLVYLLMRRLFSSRVTFVAVLSSFVAYSSNVQDVFYGYYQSSLLLAVLSLYFAVRCYETFRRDALRYPVFFGIASAVLLLFKQSMGVFPIAVGLALLALTARANKGRALRNAGVSALAYLVVLAIAMAVLAANQALMPALDQVVGGSSSKGSLSTVLFGFLGRVPMRPPFELLVGVLGVAVLLKLATWSKRRHGTKSPYYNATSIAAVIAAWFVFDGAIWSPIRTALGGFSLLNIYPTLVRLLLFGLIGFILLGQALALLRRGHRFRLIALAVVSAWAVGIFVYLRLVPLNYIDFAYIRDQRQYLVYAAFFILPIYFVYVSSQLIRAREGDYPVKLIICVAAFSIMYIHGMSGVIEDHAMLLGGSLLIGTVLSTAVAWTIVRDSAVYFACAVMVFTIVVQRNSIPYYWWGVNNLPPTWGATSTFEDPHLAGIYSNAAYTDVMNAIYRIIEANKHAGDTMYSFPHINYFNVMSGLPSPTFGKVDYFDVAPDSVASRDAALLRKNPPTFIVWMEFTSTEWNEHEAKFRGGKESGQRQIQRVYEQLTSSGAYVRLGRYYIGNSDRVDIYILNDGRRVLLARQGGSVQTPRGILVN